jgi:hypothetical protein
MLSAGSGIVHATQAGGWTLIARKRLERVERLFNPHFALEIRDKLGNSTVFERRKSIQRPKFRTGVPAPTDRFK